MNFDSSFVGAQGDEPQGSPSHGGSTYSEIRKALFENRYYETWRGPGESPLPIYGVTLGRVLKGILPGGSMWQFLEAARRAVSSPLDLRWGPDGKGWRRLLHPNGVCLLGRWEIDDVDTGYTGYFAGGSKGLIVGRYSTCCTEVRAGKYRSLSLVGKIFPTEKPDDSRRLRTANFITQEDLGGTVTQSFSEAVLRNAPDTSSWRRGLGLPILLLTGATFMLADKEVTQRQLYPIAELCKPDDVETKAPRFMQLRVVRPIQTIAEHQIDFRDEILGQFYEPGSSTPNGKLQFDIEVSDEGWTLGKLVIERRYFGPWKRIGRIVFEDAVASYNGDFVLHFHHPPWRRDRNDPNSVARVGK